ncbi:MAG: hypothetical protein ABI778_02300 [Ignavibacteriota bacterium]
MTEISSKRKALQVTYIVLAALFIVFILLNELFWRYSSKLDLTIRTSLRNTSQQLRAVIIHQWSQSAVDTSRREYKEILHGVTDVSLVLEGSKDSIHFLLPGKYISEVREIHISSDSSRQLLLIPNTLQGMPSGSNRVLYLRNDSLALLNFDAFIGDVDRDGNDEVNIPAEGGWVRLNTGSGKWVPATLTR